MRLVHVGRFVVSVVTLFVVAAIAVAPGALAQDGDGVDVSAQAGIGGWYRPGEPMPVVVQLESDELVTGVLQLRSTFDDQTRSVPVELPAGTRRELVLSVPTPVFDPGPSPYRVEFTDGDGNTTGANPSARPAYDGLVTVLGGLSATAPERVVLAATGITTEIVAIDAERLSVPGFLGPTSILVTESGDLERLDPVALTQVLDWVTTGGQLVVDDAVDTVSVLPAEWQPGPDGRARPGRGMVITTGGRLAAGEWTTLDAAPMGTTRDFWGGPMGGFEGATQSAARDAGLKNVAIGGPLTLVIVYALIAGPVAYVLMRQRRRTGLIWLAVPLLAVVTTSAIVATGSSARASTRFTHVAVLETGAGPGHFYAAVGATTPGGGTVDYDIPPGAIASFANDQFFDGNGNNGRSSVVGTGGGSRLALDVPAGGYTAGRIQGPAPDSDARLSVTAVADGDDIAITVTNDTPWALEEVGVFAGRNRALHVGDLAAGASVETTLKPVVGSRDPYLPSAATVWPGSVGWDRPPEVTGPVAFSIYSEFTGSHGMSASPGGLVTAIGWTRDADVPSGSGVGRTGVIGRTVVDGQGYQPAATQVDTVHAGAFDDFGNGMPTVPVILRVIPNELPAAGERIHIAVPASTTEAEVRRGGEWAPAELTGQLLEFDPQMTGRVAIDPADCTGGVCYVRVRAVIDGLEQGFPAEGISS